MKREYLQGLKVGDQTLPKEVVDEIMAQHGKSVEAHKQAARQWQEKYESAVTAHTEELARVRFDGIVKDAVTASRGRNLKAITALLDLAALKASDDPAQAVQQAVAQVKQENAYLFLEEAAQPPYAKGTGTNPNREEPATDSLAGALRQRFAKT